MLLSTGTVTFTRRRNNALRYLFEKRDETVIGWLSGESLMMGAEGESGESCESLRQKDSVEIV